MTLDDPAVLAFDVARLHRAAQRAERGFGFRNQQEARGIAIEPMHEAAANRLAR